jgi:small subunit ribosomal protein S15
MARTAYLSPAKKQEIFEKDGFQKSKTDTGSAESQIALFTYRINHLTQHLKNNRKDHATRLGLLKLVGKRRRLLDYLAKTDIERYRAIVKSLGIRK